jgi:O-acetyl-ADP-ribose deacetylase (regulator of RNase III)
MASTDSSNDAPFKLPDIHLLCMNTDDALAFNTAAEALFPDLQEHTTLTGHRCSLSYLVSHNADLRIDAVVSPANSYARLDGAFDDALARAYGPKDYSWITRRAQDVLYQRWRGFAPPGTCTVVPLEDDKWSAEKNPFQTKYMMLCPTMRIPQEVVWDREVIYECIWSLLCAIVEHNRQIDEGVQGKRIESILMTPLATGVGQVKAKRWAEQTVLAAKHFVEANEKPEKWSRLNWGMILEDHREVEATYSRRSQAS